MAGVLFVISIPTEAEELRLKNKPRKLQFKAVPSVEQQEPLTPVQSKPSGFLKVKIYWCYFSCQN